MNFELVLIQIVIGILIGLVLIKLFQTKKSISYEKRLGTYSISSIKDNELAFFDQVHLFFYGLIKSFSKFLSKFKTLNRTSKKYLKYITYSRKDEYESIDLLAIKYLVMIISIMIGIIFSLIRFNNINYLLFVFSLLSYYIFDIVLSIEFKNRKKQIEDELLKAIMIMNNSFKTGRNVVQAIETVTEELSGPIQDEFKKILVDVRYGLSYDVAFKRFYQRVLVDDAKYIATSLVLVNKTGGNISHVFNNIESSILSRKKLLEELSSLTSAAKLMFKILTIFPLIMILIILLLNKNYFKPFFTNPIGFIFFFLALVLFISYVIIIRKILKVAIR